MMNCSNEKITADPIKVVLVEKYPLARAALARLLKDDGYEVYQAQNRQTAIKYTQALEDIRRLARRFGNGWLALSRQGGGTETQCVCDSDGRRSARFRNAAFQATRYTRMPQKADHLRRRSYGNQTKIEKSSTHSTETHDGQRRPIYSVGKSLAEPQLISPNFRLRYRDKFALHWTTTFRSNHIRRR